MTKQKRSFFERLTGSRQIENDEEDKVLNVSSEDDQEETIINAPSDFTMPEESKIDEHPMKQNDDDDGQLTIDVYQTENDIIIKSTIAGVKPEDLDVSINNDMITIRGERKMDEEVSQENYYYQECYWGSFSRSVIIPVDVLTDKAEASLKNGILTIRLPKAVKDKVKKIQVRGF